MHRFGNSLWQLSIVFGVTGNYVLVWIVSMASENCLNFQRTAIIVTDVLVRLPSLFSHLYIQNVYINVHYLLICSIY